MKKRVIRVLSYILVAALASAITFGLMQPPAAGESKISKLDQLEALIEERFIGEVDTVAIEDAAADAMVEALGDRWSYYIPQDEYESYLEQMMNSYVGIGVTITATEDSTGVNVVGESEGGPAEEAGSLVGDRIIAVAGQSILGMNTTDTRNLVRGEEGTFVDITVLREGAEQTFSVERRRLEIPVAEGELLDNGIGLVTIYNFDARCAKETIAKIEELMAQGADKLIFDVRNNPGGYASELVKLLDYLLPEGELFHMEHYTGEETFDYSDADCLEIPMAVLVNADSYSAAEFFAVALQEYEAGIVVGEKTSGKGYFQTTIELVDSSAVGLSVGKYYTPSGLSLEGVGITPDIEVYVDQETYEKIAYDQLTNEEDPQLQAAIEALQ